MTVEHEHIRDVTSYSHLIPFYSIQVGKKERKERNEVDELSHWILAGSASSQMRLCFNIRLALAQLTLL